MQLQWVCFHRTANTLEESLELKMLKRWLVQSNYWRSVIKYLVHPQAEETSPPSLLLLFKQPCVSPAPESRKTCSPHTPVLLSEGRALTQNQRDKRPHTFLFRTHACQCRRGTATKGGGVTPKQGCWSPPITKSNSSVAKECNKVLSYHLMITYKKNPQNILNSIFAGLLWWRKKDQCKQGSELF